MKITSLGKNEIKEHSHGVYLWQMPDGSFVGDDDGHFFMISGLENDSTIINKLEDAVRSEFGIFEGGAKFFRGHRIVSDEEYEYQKQRMEWGLVPDPLDTPAMEEDRYEHKRSG